MKGQFREENMVFLIDFGIGKYFLNLTQIPLIINKIVTWYYIKIKNFSFSKEIIAQTSHKVGEEIRNI